ncbi:MAG TPA: protein kinase [Longimicrobiales bacterium]|nr:protein kinase [Longimicrobiales bacterium]
MSTPVIERLNAALSGRYEVEREIGAGGMATVYLARDVKHNRRVALKVLKPELAAVVGADRFLTEIETTAGLQHPHILPLFDSGEADGFLFYVMPYVEGETLRDRIDRERQLPVDEAIGIATAVANALHAAHERGIVHRDIKPGNILLSQGEPLVADFGIALAVGAAGGSRLTETGLSVGTPYYMSPEQATGDQMVGPASDTFALACVLYEMLVGEPPYPGNTAQAVLGKIIQGLPVSATAVRRSVPVNVDAAIRRALEKLPADRFTDAKGFVKALADPSFRHGEADAAAALAGRSWTALTSGVTAAAVVFAGLAAWGWLRPPPPAAMARFATPFLQDQEPLGTGQGAFDISDDGSFVVYAGPGGTPGTNTLWVRRWDVLEAQPIRGTDGGVEPKISPDGREVAFRQGAQIKVVAVEGGPVRTLLNGYWPRWGRDGYVYAQIASVGTGRVLATGGPTDTVTALAAGDAQQIVNEVFPESNGALLEVLLGGGAFEVRVLDLGSGEARHLLSGEDPQYVETGHLVWIDNGTLMGAPFDTRALELTGPAVALLEGVNAHSVSRDGDLLYSTGGGGAPDRQLVWVTRGGQVTPIDPDWTFRQGDTNQSWTISPDGSRLALREQTENGYDIWIKELDDGPRSRLTFDDVQNYFPTWSPDGRRVVYVAGPATDLDVWTKPADGTGSAEVLLDLEESIALALWSPDGEWLVLRTTTGAGNVFGRDIIAVRPGSDPEPVPLMTAEYDETEPAVSPDGRWIAYQSNETDRFEVYVRPFPNVQDGRWQVSTEGGTSPRWAGDGRELFFKDDRRNLVVASVDAAGGSFRAGRPEVLFSIPSDIVVGSALTMPYDVTADGERFLMARVAGDTSGGGTAPSFVLVQNWVQELTTRVPR